MTTFVPKDTPGQGGQYDERGDWWQDEEVFLIRWMENGCHVQEVSLDDLARAPKGPHPVAQLYRHFDEEGILLYVGVSLSAVARLAQHKRSAWHERIARVDVEHFDSRAAAEAAERRAIAMEAPVYNIARPRQVRAG